MSAQRILLVSTIILLFACSFFSTSPPSTTPSVPASAIPTLIKNVPATVINPTVAATATLTAQAPTATNSFPDPTAYNWSPVVSGFDRPVDIQFPDDGSGRMFILEQVGRIRVVQNGLLLATPFLDITDRVGSNSSERGLLGLAFHPHYKDNGYFYVNYTDKRGNTNISRFQVTADPNVADPSSEKVLLHVDQPFPNHNGGKTIFGPDGYLYLGLGDGGSQGDPYGNGQNTNVLLGKILRIDVDHGNPYAIPPDNPFVKGGGRPEIWAYGLRNPWRFSFDQVTGDLYIADVGQDTWEEVDVVSSHSAGLNFGWNYYEGLHPYTGQPPPGINITMPVTEYSHAEGGCAIIGGYVYRGTLMEWQGVYFYGDECSGKVWGLVHTESGWQSQFLYDTGLTLSSFGQDGSGEVYLAGYGDGTVYRLSH